MIPILLDPRINVFCGDLNLFDECALSRPFDPLVCHFFDTFSRRVLSSSKARIYPDLATFAFWCRQSNIKRLALEHQDQRVRIGLGMVFHVAPSNVPVNCLYSLAFGLLAGNVNIVRLPSRLYEQVEWACQIMQNLMNDVAFSPIAKRLLLIQYGHHDEVSRALSCACQGRMIWGGDETIKLFRTFPISVHAREIHFPDRTSLCVLRAESILQCDALQLNRLAEGFYNDVFVMDQNACSSPHLICWMGDKTSIDQAQHVFWKMLAVVCDQRGTQEPVHSIDKLSQACRDSIQRTEIQSIDWHNPRLFRVNLEKLPEDWLLLRGKNGYFYELSCCEEQWDIVLDHITTKVQTLTYYGFEPEKLGRELLSRSVRGIDRIVPVGSALDMDLLWDGRLMIHELSRIIDVR